MAQVNDRSSAAVHRQVEAMGGEVFEIGVYRADSRESDRHMLLRTWDVETLSRSIPWLKQQNREGCNIYIRPHGEHNLSLVDDLKLDQVKVMKEAGFAPALVVETSPGNLQAWLKHPETLPRETSTIAARGLAKRFGGDKGSADWRHFGRLAGFTNRKPKYQDVGTGFFPFVKLVDATGELYKAGVWLISRAKGYLEREHQHQEELRLKFRERGTTPPTKTIEHFRADPRYSEDHTRADMAFAVYALSHGAAAGDVAAALRSRDLSHKGNERRQIDYVERTIRKAGMQR